MTTLKNQLAETIIEELVAQFDFDTDKAAFAASVLLDKLGETLAMNKVKIVGRQPTEAMRKEGDLHSEWMPTPSTAWRWMFDAAPDLLAGGE